MDPVALAQAALDGAKAANCNSDILTALQKDLEDRIAQRAAARSLPEKLSDANTRTQRAQVAHQKAIDEVARLQTLLDTA